MDAENKTIVGSGGECLKWNVITLISSIMFALYNWFINVNENVFSDNLICTKITLLKRK